MSHVNLYHEWLGVNPQGETPSYYELLGLRPLESDTAKVEAAYQRQSAKVAAQLSGPYVADAQRLMGELAEARMTLLTPTAKRAYDAALAAAVGATAAKDVNTPSAMAPAATPQLISTTTVAPQAFAPQPTAPQPVSAQPFPATGYGQPQPVQQPGYGYVGPSPNYGAPAYGAQGAPAAMPVYPGGQTYPGWQGQSAAPVNATAHGYSPLPTAPQAAVSEAPSIPAIRPRRARRRSSPAPAVFGALMVLAALAGGWFYYTKSDETLVVVEPKRQGAGATAKKPSAVKGAADASPGGQRSVTEKNDRQPNHKGGRATTNQRDLRTSPTVKPPTVLPASTLTPESPGGDGKAGMEKAEREKPKPDTDMPESGKPAPTKPGPDKPEPDKPKDAPIPERKAGSEEAATVGKLLKAARTALTDRDVSKAQDLLAEATIEATAPDTTAEVGRVELLASYVEMFWDAVRKTLPKIALEELEINGTMLAVVEADENHLIVRAEGRNREYTLQKLPHDIAYYLANRWLAPDDPLRNLVLASFEIVDAKGDRNRAQSLLDAAADARLKTEPLREELRRAAAP